MTLDPRLVGAMGGVSRAIARGDVLDARDRLIGAGVQLGPALAFLATQRKDIAMCEFDQCGAAAERAAYPMTSMKASSSDTSSIPTVHLALDDVDAKLDVVRDRLSVLHMRLEPVLGYGTPEVAGHDRPIPDGGSSVANRIISHATSLHEITEGILALTSRLTV